MLSKLINTQIYNDVNNLNKLKYLNDKNKKINKYNNINIKEKKFFDIKNKIVLLDKPNENNENEDKKNEYIINKNIKKINNVYKINYKNSESSGFGDFIRGCYFLLEFCEKRNIDVDFYIHDNNVKYFLKHFLIKPNINNFIANNIKRYTKSNCDFIETYGVINYEINNNNYGDFIDYLNSCNVYSNNIFMNTINFPSHNISTKHINYMKQLLEPIESFKVELDNKLHNLGLEKHNFNVYHIRLGDKYLNNNNNKNNNNNTIEIKVLNKILNNLNINNAENYLLISDSILIKIY